MRTHICACLQDVWERRQERRLNSFHLRCLRRILGISWQDRVPNKDVLERAGIPSMFAMLSQRRLRWLGHILRMEDGRLPKDVLYDELTSGSRPVGRPMLRYKDVCKRDMKSAEINPNSWEAAAADRSNWRHIGRTGVRRAEARREELWRDRERGQLQHPRNQHLTLAATVPKTACPELGSTVTADAALERTDISDAVHCLSRQTETTNRTCESA